MKAGFADRLFWRRALKWLQRVLLAAAIILIGTYLAAHGDVVRTTFAALDPRRLLLVALCLGVLHPAIAFVFWCIQRGFGIQRSYRRTLRSYVLRLPARFVPGGVWHSLARYADIHGDDEATARKLGGMFFVEVLVVASGGCLASGILALSFIDLHGITQMLAWLMLGAGLAGSAAPLFVPAWRRRMRVDWHWFAAIGVITGVWVGFGAAFGLVAQAIGGPFMQCDALALSATYATSATAGYVAIFAPQGWGVTDGVFALLRPCPVPIAALLSAILALRLITIAVDLGFWTTGWALSVRRSS